MVRDRQLWHPAKVRELLQQRSEQQTYLLGRRPRSLAKFLQCTHRQLQSLPRQLEQDGPVHLAVPLRRSPPEEDRRAF